MSISVESMAIELMQLGTCQLPLYDYLTPKLDFKRKFNHRQSFLYKGRLMVRNSKISNRIITTNRIPNRKFDSKSNRVSKLRRSLVKYLIIVLQSVSPMCVDAAEKHKVPHTVSRHAVEAAVLSVWLCITCHYISQF